MKEVAATIDDPADKRAAKHDIADVEDILDEELNGSPISVAMTRILSEAGRNEGTPEARIAPRWSRHDRHRQHHLGKPQ